MELKYILSIKRLEFLYPSILSLVIEKTNYNSIIFFFFFLIIKGLFRRQSENKTLKTVEIKQK